MNPTLKFENVSKLYRTGMTRTSLPTILNLSMNNLLGRKRITDNRSFWAVKDVSFNLEQGQSLALIGPNGAGKTTILKLLANITKPTYGAVRYEGRMTALIELGAGFHPDLSGRENIYLNGSILGLNKDYIRRRFDAIVDFSELEEFIDTPIKRYSTGMAVRLGFAVAANLDANILLVDEVLAVGDIAFRHKCMKHIHEILDRGTILIFVSHNMGLLKAVCNLGLYVDHGKLRYFGATNEAIEEYYRIQNEKRIEEMQSNSYLTSRNEGYIEITKLELLGPDSKIAKNFRSNQPIIVSIHYFANSPITQMAVVLRIRRADGLSCSVIYSNLDGINYSVGKGAGFIKITINPIQLFTGVYYIVATFKDVSRGITYSIESSEWFRVIGNSIGLEDQDGVFEPNRVWDLNQSVTDNKHVRIDSTGMAHNLHDETG
jgi:lipopolysaccharide transport system ATP-binding protein